MDKNIRGTESYPFLFLKGMGNFPDLLDFFEPDHVSGCLWLVRKGLLSDRTYTSKGVRVEYNKFMRVEKGTELVIYLTDLGENGQISINNEINTKFI